MTMLLVIALRLILVHGANHEEISLSVDEVSSIRQVLSHRKEDDTFHKNVNCVIVMTNGRFIGVTEKCIDVIHLMSEAAKKEPQ